MHQWSERLAPHLAALVALAEYDGHMTRAAEALGVPQSSMSRRVHALEQALRVPLLIHDGRIVRLTPAAQDLARAALDPLRQLDLAVGVITGEADPDHGTVSLGSPLTMGSVLIADLLAAFRRRHPGIRVALKQAHGAELSTDLLAGRLDLAIAIPPPQRLRHQIIGTQQIYAVLPVEHRFADRTSVQIHDLKDEVFIANPASYNLRQLTEAWCQEAGFVPTITLEVTEFTTVRALISRGLGIGLLPRDEQLPEGAVERPLAGNRYQRDIALAWGATVETPVTRQLSTFLLNEFTPRR